MPDQAATLEILIQIRDELAGLNRTREGLKATKQEAQGLGSLLKQGLGIGSGMEIARRGLNLLTQSFEDAVGGAFRLAEEVNDQSEALNLTTDAYQVLRFELMQAGVDASRLTMAISTQTQTLADARSGAGAAAEAYKTLGLRAAEIEQLRPEERLAAVARATLNATDKTKAFQAAGQILGQRGLPQLLNALRNLAENGYDSVASAAKAAGAVMAGETVDMLDKAKQRVDNFKSTTLPIAAGTAIGWVQSAMDRVGAGFANAESNFKGLPLGDMSVLTAPPPKPRITMPTGPIYANEEQVVLARTSAVETKASQIQSAALLEEHEKRRALIPILREQEQLYKKLIELRFGKDEKIPEGGFDTKEEYDAFQKREQMRGKALPANGQVTEEELTRYKERNELESKLVAIRQQRMEAVDTPLLALSRQLGDTTQVASDIMNNSLNAGMSALTSNLTAVAMGTGKLSDVFKSFGRIAIQAIMELLVKLLIIRPFLTMFGITPAAQTTANVGIGATQAVGTIKSAGGGSFLTSGPTNLTVGDNPGGIEMVSVTPISGIGRTTVSGRVARMAGGGNLLAGGRGFGGDTFQFSYAFNGGVSREEVLGLLPMMIEGSKNAVLEAKRRRRDGFR